MLRSQHQWQPCVRQSWRCARAETLTHWRKKKTSQPIQAIDLLMVRYYFCIPVLMKVIDARFSNTLNAVKFSRIGVPLALLLGMGMALLITSGCNGEPVEQETSQEDAALAAVRTPDTSGMLSDALDALKDGASRVQKAVEPYASPIQGTAVESIQKMLAIDYRVIEVGHDQPLESIESTLNHLGKDRWDCSPMPASPTRIRFLCKRLPVSSYLKGLSLLTKLVPE